MRELREDRPAEDLEALAARVAAGDRRGLARAITLVESTRPDHRRVAQALIARLAPHSGGALRIGLTGTPGVGKSSFVERFGTMLTEMGKRIAVLAVDPSSARTGGSILGDKTRMERLARDPRAFIRPSPSGRALGGVARRTRETILLAEAWGADAVLVETVGVGQSETLVAEMTDAFVLLIAPGGGDELQGVKRGIMEMADLVLVNKADGALAQAARATAADYAGALRLMRHRSEDPKGFPKVLCVSALTGAGLEAAWEEIAALDRWRRDAGLREARRRAQALSWFEQALEQGLRARLAADGQVAARRRMLAEAVAAGRIAPEAAAEALIDEVVAGSPGRLDAPLPGR